jgi:hypothetical protein
VPFPVPLFGAFFWCLSPGSTKAPSYPVVPFLGAFDKCTGKGTKPVPFLGAFVVLVPFFWCLSQNLVQCIHGSSSGYLVMGVVAAAGARAKLRCIDNMSNDPRRQHSGHRQCVEPSANYICFYKV